MSIISAGGAVTGADVGPTIDPRDYFNPILYNGNGSTGQTVTGVGFQPDLVVLKNRNIGGGYPTFFYDAVRGAGIALRSDNASAETNRSAVFSAFTSDGFTFPAGQGNTLENDSAGLYVAWNWKANGAGSSNTAGSISSTVSASTDSGFSIVTYTGTATNATVGHGLGIAPKMVIVKRRVTSNGDWLVYHGSLTSSSHALFLNDTAAQANDSTYFNGTAPTSTVFSVGTNANTNRSGENTVAYCFAEITDFSKIGSYTGNGSATGPTITTDFEPTWLMIKRSDSTGDWIIHDSARDATNPRTAFLRANTVGVEATGNDVDFNATSFQIKSTSATVNASGGTYIYMCIA